jgi:hypothetical protein
MRWINMIMKKVVVARGEKVIPLKPVSEAHKNRMESLQKSIALLTIQARVNREHLQRIADTGDAESARIASEALNYDYTDIDPIAELLKGDI